MSLTITYDSYLINPTLKHPNENERYLDRPFHCSWAYVPGSARYRLQIDNTPSFDSPNLIDYTTQSSYEYTYAIPFDGIWYWRVATIDWTDVQGPFSPYRSFYYDVDPPDPPTMIYPPDDFVTNKSLVFQWNEDPEAVYYILEIESGFGVDYMLYNYTIFEGTTLTPDWDLDALIEQTYCLWGISAVDDYGRRGYRNIGFISFDVLPPEIELSQGHISSHIDADDSLSFTLRGFDLSRVINWTIDPPNILQLTVERVPHNELESLCTVSKETLLAPGPYEFNICATDLFGYTTYFSFDFEVRPSIPGFPIEAVLLGVIVALIPVLLFRRHRKELAPKNYEDQ
jgi:hypothetical protein